MNSNVAIIEYNKYKITTNLNVAIIKCTTDSITCTSLYQVSRLLL